MSVVDKDAIGRAHPGGYSFATRDLFVPVIPGGECFQRESLVFRLSSICGADDLADIYVGSVRIS